MDNQAICDAYVAMFLQQQVPATMFWELVAVISEYTGCTPSPHPDPPPDP